MYPELENREQITERLLLPNWQLAQKHALAVSVGRPTTLQGHRQVCECCNNVVERQHLDLGTNIKNLSFLGFGMPLYFLFLQYCIILNLLLVLTDGIMMTTEAIQHNGNKCKNYPKPHANANVTASPAVHHFMAFAQQTHFSDAHTHFSGAQSHFSGGGAHGEAEKFKILCTNSFVYIANVNDESSTTEMVARISSFIIQTLFLVYVKNSLQRTGQYYNQISVDLSDYSVIFKGLPEHIHNKRRKFDQMIFGVRRWDNQPLTYYDIIVVPENQRLEDLIQRKDKLNEDYLHARLKDTHAASQLFKEYKANHHELHQEIARSKVQLRNDTMGSENVILVFQTQADRQFFMDEANKPVIRAKLADMFGPEWVEGIEVSKCSDPKEIMWHHLQHFSSRNFKIFKGWFLSFLFLFVFFVIFYYLSAWKAKQLSMASQGVGTNNPDAQLELAIAGIIAWCTLIGIVLFNKFVMGPVLHYFTHLEHHDDKANEDFSFAFKYALGMFFTTCLMTITVQAIMHKNYYSHPFGIVEQESLMFIFSSVLVPLIWLIHPYQLAHKFQRWMYQGTDFVTQKEANLLMADYEYSVGKRYAEILEMMWFAFLYVDLIPAGTMAILVGLCAYYWVDKYNLLNRSSAPHNISMSLSFKITKLLDLTLVWRFIGETIFDFQLKGKVDLITFILLAFSILFLLLPWKQILDEVAGEEFKLNEKRLSEVYHLYFEEDNYIDMNPIYNELELTAQEKRVLKQMVSKKKNGFWYQRMPFIDS